MLLLYASLALLLLLLVFFLARPAKPEGMIEETFPKHHAQDLGDERWLSLSQIIFDPSDSRWLRDQLGFPQLAHSLAQARKQLAIQWLISLRRSFDEVIRTPEANLAGSDPAPLPLRGWRFLWLTVRFYTLVTYALLVVRILGPYHRLYPSFGWTRFVEGRGFPRTHLSVANDHRAR